MLSMEPTTKLYTTTEGVTCRIWRCRSAKNEITGDVYVLAIIPDPGCEAEFGRRYPDHGRRT